MVRMMAWVQGVVGGAVVGTAEDIGARRTVPALYGDDDDDDEHEHDFACIG